MTTNTIRPGEAYTFLFTNYKGDTAQRVVIARALHWGDTPWHKECQFFLEGFDLAKKEVRLFPILGIAPRTFRLYTDAELDVYLTGLELAAAQKVRDEIAKETTA